MIYKLHNDKPFSDIHEKRRNMCSAIV